MKSIGRILLSRTSSLVRGLLPIPGSSRIVRKIGCDLLSRGDIQLNFCHITLFFQMLYLSNSNLFFLNKG